MNSPILTIISFILIFTVVVVSHEFGHFLIARINGIRVNEFSIGMGPALFRKKGKMTELVIRLLPIGGACIFDGEDGKESVIDNKEEEELSGDGDGKKRKRFRPKAKPFQEAPVWGRIAAVVAGPLFNIILAYLLSLVVIWFTGVSTPVIDEVYDNYPGKAAGLQAGDEIVKIDGHSTHLWDDVRIYTLLSSGDSLHITYLRNGEKRETDLTPYLDPESGNYFIGIAHKADNILDCRNLRVLKYSWHNVEFWLSATIQSLKYMIGGHARLDDLAGPVGVANIIDDTIEDAAPHGAFTVILSMFNIAILLSVNLGVLNLLPIPALDGGRLLFLLFEAVSGKKVPPEKEGLVHLIGFVLLMILMVVVLINDIGRFFR